VRYRGRSGRRRGWRQQRWLIRARHALNGLFTLLVPCFTDSMLHHANYDAQPGRDLAESRIGAVLPTSRQANSASWSGSGS
jgi:hypothetical protein